jgi:peptidoglycan DL-endopeptidase CwlO
VTLARTSRRTRALVTLATALVLGLGAVATPTTALADPETAAQAEKLVEQAAQKLTVIDEQVHEAEITVADQQDAAQAAARKARKAQDLVAAFEPRLRAIAQSGYTGKSQSRVAAFLTSESADDLVQQMTTLDMIASHTETIVAAASRAQDAALAAEAAAEEAAATAKAGLAELQEQKKELERRVAEYEATFARLTAEEQARVTAAVAGPTLRTPSLDDLPEAPGAAGTAIALALSKVGSPYVWGASGPTGFDCSGLTSFAYRAAGISLPHSSRAQSGIGMRVSRSDLQPGDLVFFYSPISHVGLYIGNGMMVHARTFGQPVAVTSVDQAGYQFATRIVR